MEVLIPILIYFVVPGLGLWGFLRVKESMHQQQIPGLLNAPLFLVFASYGGCLLVLLTQFFWYTSGMALIGVVYLIFVAPIVLGCFAWRLYGQRKQSQFYFRLFLACACYPVLPAAVIVAVFIRFWLFLS